MQLKSLIIRRGIKLGGKCFNVASFIDRNKCGIIIGIISCNLISINKKISKSLINEWTDYIPKRFVNVCVISNLYLQKIPPSICNLSFTSFYHFKMLSSKLFIYLLFQYLAATLFTNNKVINFILFLIDINHLPNSLFIETWILKMCKRTFCNWALSFSLSVSLNDWWYIAKIYQMAYVKTNEIFKRLY